MPNSDNPFLDLPMAGAMPDVGDLQGTLHLNEQIAPKVPKGKARPLAPGEYILNPQGSWSSEITATIPSGQAPGFNEGKATVVPTLWLINGKPRRVSEDEAVKLARESGLKFRSFDSTDAAEKYANSRESGWQTMKPEEAAKVAPLWDSGMGIGAASEASIRPTAEDNPFMQAPAAPSFLSRLKKGEEQAMRAVVSATGLADEVGAAGRWVGQKLREVAPLPGTEPPQRTIKDVIAGMGPHKEYGQLLGEERQKERDIPAAIDIPGKVVGGFAMGAPAKAVQGAAVIAGKIPSWLKNVGLGGLFGGLFGFGSGEGDFVNRLESAGEGLLTGSALTAAGEGLIRGGSAAWRALRGTVKAPEQIAAEKVAEAFRLDDTPAGRARARLKDLGPQATLADVGGENVRGLARGATVSPGEARNRVRMTLDQRAESEAQRLTGSMNRGLKPEDFFAAEDQMLGQLKTNARQAYQQAYEANPVLTSPKLNRMMSDPLVKAGIKRAAEDASRMRLAGESKWLGPVDKELTDLAAEVEGLPKRPGVAKGLSLETWDAIKQGIDDVLFNPDGLTRAASNELTGGFNRKGVATNAMRKALVNELDRLTGGENSLYRAARAQYSDDAAVLNALRNGRDFMKLEPQEVQRTMDGMSDAEKQAFRSGAARTILKTIEDTPDGTSAALRLSNTSAKRARIRALFPDQQSYLDFMRTLTAEKRFAQTRREVTQGSRTTPMKAEQEALERGAGTVGALAGSASGIPGSHLITAGIGRMMARRAAEQALNQQEVNALIARTLINRNPAMNQGALDRVAGMANKQMNDQARLAIMRALLRRSAPAASEQVIDTVNQR